MADTHKKRGKTMKSFARFGLFFTLIASIFIGFACGPTKVPVQVMKPARVNLKGIRRVAVTEFTGPGQSGKLVVSILNSKLLNSNYFDVLEREKLQDVMREYQLSMAGIVNPDQAKQIGQLLGVDGIITGEVTAYSVEDESGKERVKESVWTGKYEKDSKGNFIYTKDIFGKKHKKKIYREQFVTHYYKIRRGTVTVTFRVIDVASGAILTAKTYSRNYTSSKIRDGRGSLKSRDAILTDLTNQIVSEFVRDIAPHKVTLKRTILGGPGPIDAGKKMAQNNLWPEATKLWEQAVKMFPNKPEAFYDLGLAYEVQGRLDDAEKLYQKAVQLKPEKLYMRALSGIRQAKLERLKLEEQLKGRNLKR